MLFHQRSLSTNAPPHAWPPLCVPEHVDSPYSPRPYSPPSFKTSRSRFGIHKPSPVPYPSHTSCLPIPQRSGFCGHAKPRRSLRTSSSHVHRPDQEWYVCELIWRIRGLIACRFVLSGTTGCLCPLRTNPLSVLIKQGQENVLVSAFADQIRAGLQGG